MKKLLSLFGLIGILSFANANSQTSVGAGLSQDYSIIRATIGLSDELRLEPYLGFSYSKPDGGVKTTSFDIGVAIEVVKSINNSLNGYFGGFVGLNNYDTGGISNNTFLLGPVGGVEYFFNSQFSLGGEIRLEVGFGDTTRFNTDSIVLLRYYF